MDFKTIRTKIITRWWWLVLSILVFNLIFWPLITKKEYIAEIQVGVNFNNSALLNISDKTFTVGYIDSLEDFSIYLQNRFKSLAIQTELARKVNLNIKKLNLDIPFYTIKSQKMGFVLIQYKTDSEDLARLFLNEVKEVYKTRIIPEWNESRQEVFKIEGMQNFQTAIVELDKPKQALIMPSVAGALVGFSLILFLPQKQEKQEIEITKTEINKTKKIKNKDKQS